MSQWYLPESRKNIIRAYSGSICSNRWPFITRRYVLYLLLRPSLGWLAESISKTGLQPAEADSEIFLICHKLLQKFEPSKSSLLLYLEKRIPWEAAELLKRLRENSVERPSGLINLPEELYEMEDEVYLSTPKFLLEDRFLGKDLSQADKTFILKLITGDEYGCRSLGRMCNRSKSLINSRMQHLQRLLKEKMNYHVRERNSGI